MRFETLVGPGFGEVIGELANHALCWGAPLAGWEPGCTVVIDGLVELGEPRELARVVGEVMREAAAAYGAILALAPAPEGPSGADAQVCAQLLMLCGAVARLERTAAQTDLENAVGAARRVALHLASRYGGGRAHG